MTPWRVAHVVVTEAFAGTERYVANLAGAQHRDGHRVTVLGGDPVAMRAALPSGVHLEAVSTVAGAVAALRRLGPFEVVHAHLTAAETAVCLAFPWRQSDPIIVSTRHIAGRRGSSSAAKAVSVGIRYRVDLQIACSTYVAGRIDGPSVVLPTGVAPRGQCTGERPVVLVAQRLEQEKDTATAIRAWAASGLGRRGWRLEVLGSGTQRASLEDLAGDLSVAGSVDFEGWVGDIDTRLATASILLAPTPGETFGLTVVEAMAWGLPVVAAASGGHLETVGAVPGARMFTPGDAYGAASLLSGLAADPFERREYGRSLREHQRSHLNLEAHAAAVADAYLIARQEKATTIRNRQQRRHPCRLHR